jgi:hypothetical protein
MGGLLSFSCKVRIMGPSGQCETWEGYNGGKAEQNSIFYYTLNIGSLANYVNEKSYVVVVE